MFKKFIDLFYYYMLFYLRYMLNKSAAPMALPANIASSAFMQMFYYYIRVRRFYLLYLFNAYIYHEDYSVHCTVFCCKQLCSYD